MKKVLIVAYYWPPAGGPGVQRWLHFVNYLPQFDIEPIVVVPENPTYPIIDESLVKQVNKEVCIVKLPIWEPYRYAEWFSKKDSKTISSGIIEEEQKQSLLQKLFLFIRGNFFIPDARKYWVAPSVNYLKKFMVNNQISTLITTGPPHSVHLIGLQLKEQLGITWIADFRDPWTSIGYHKQLKLTKSSLKKHKALEKKVLLTADELITTSYKTKEDFSKLTSKTISVITNGYEEIKLPEVSLTKKFTMAHIGSLLSERNPDKLWKVLAELCTEHEKFHENFELVLAGKVSQKVLNSINNHGLTSYLKNVGYIPHQEAVLLQQQSQVLLLLEINSEETKAIIPGKLFEYLNARRPIIAIGPENWDVQQIMKKVGAGDTYTYSDEQEIKDKLLHYFDCYVAGKLSVSYTGLELFSRKKLTQDLAKRLKSF